MNTVNEIKLILEKAFQIDALKIDDQTEFHRNHPGAKESGGGHFSITVVSSDFQDKNRIQRHRMIYKALDSLIPHTIHALAIDAKTPDE